MPRERRIVVPNTPHHVTQRGSRRQRVFFSASDYDLYAELLREHCRKHDVDILQWHGMENHVHLMLLPHDRNGLALALRSLS